MQNLGIFMIITSVLLLSSNVAILLYHSVAGSEVNEDLHLGAAILSLFVGSLGFIALGGK